MALATSACAAAPSSETAGISASGDCSQVAPDVTVALDADDASGAAGSDGARYGRSCGRFVADFTGAPRTRRLTLAASGGGALSPAACATAQLSLSAWGWVGNSHSNEEQPAHWELFADSTSGGQWADGGCQLVGRASEERFAYPDLRVAASLVVDGREPAPVQLSVAP
jgi:hypothetical protein